MVGKGEVRGVIWLVHLLCCD